jgi:hypothetical protein
MKPLERPSLENLASNVWICADCSLERGYGWPNSGAVLERIGCCDLCTKRGVAFKRDDLVPVWELNTQTKGN